jgi:hypothetical protein
VGVSSHGVTPSMQASAYHQERLMKSRIIHSFRAMSPWPSRDLPVLSSGLASGLTRAGMALGSAISVLSLAGCYYPYGYYPSGYYAPAYVPPPATTTQQGAPADQANTADTQQQAAPAQAQTPVQVPNATYAVAAPPVYAAPVYPAYYPPPVYPYPAYPAYYGYPYWGPSVSIGIGGYWGGGWGRHWH